MENNSYEYLGATSCAFKNIHLGHLTLAFFCCCVFSVMYHLWWNLDLKKVLMTVKASTGGKCSSQTGTTSCHFSWKRLIKCSRPPLHVNSRTDDIHQAQPTAPTQSLEVQSVPSKWKCLLWWFESSHVISSFPPGVLQKEKGKKSPCTIPAQSQTVGRLTC